MEKGRSMADLKYLNRLAKDYPNIMAASAEIINLKAILALPKGTEYFLSDLHGEHEAFIHMLKSASGTIKAKIDEHYGSVLSEKDRDDLAALIYNAEAELAARLRTFRHVDLAQIAGVIEDFYGIGVAFRSEALKNIQFTGTLDFNMPIDHILEVLTLSTNTRFNRNGEKITIHK